MKISGAGAGVGALVGALGRALVVVCWLGPNFGIIVLASANIGLLVGVIAGALGKPLWGMIVGFILSAIVFEPFMCAWVSVLGAMPRLHSDSTDYPTEFLTEVLPYTLLMGLAGAAAGGIGGAVGAAAQNNGKPGGTTEQGSGGMAESGRRDPRGPRPHTT